MSAELMSADLERIQSLRKSLKAHPRPAVSLLDVVEEALEIQESIERRLRYLEQAHEDND